MGDNHGFIDSATSGWALAVVLFALALLLPSSVRAVLAWLRRMWWQVCATPRPLAAAAATASATVVGIGVLSVAMAGDNYTTPALSTPTPPVAAGNPTAHSIALVSLIVDIEDGPPEFSKPNGDIAEVATLVAAVL